VEISAGGVEAAGERSGDIKIDISRGEGAKKGGTGVAQTKRRKVQRRKIEKDRGTGVGGRRG